MSLSLGSSRPANSRIRGAAPLGPSVLLRARGLASPVPVQLLQATWVGEGKGGSGAGAGAGPRADHRAGRGAGYRQGVPDVLCEGAGLPTAGSPAAGGRHVLDDDPVPAA